MDIKSNIAIILPLEVQAFVLPIIQAYMPASAGAYTPHITLLHPFASLEELDAAGARLEALCKSIVPRHITLDGYGFFPRVAYMRVATPEPITALMQAIWQAFPEYPPYEGAYGTDIIPHVTVTHLEEGHEKPVLPAYDPITFEVDRLHVNYGVVGGMYQWISHDVIRLQGKNSRDD